MSLESLQRDGRAAYENGDFTKALECFNRAVGKGNPSSKLLDSVAATHLRLGALKEALAAAKKTIQAGREDATGYLRAGQVLLKMDKASTALEIYAHGLKTIKHVGTGFEKLKKAHDQLLQQLAPTNSIDPLTVLPRELAISVLEYLTFRQRIAVSRVSKGWTAFIRSEPSLWSHLDLSSARKKVKTSFVSTAINVARKKITKATLNQLYDFDKVLAALVKHCPLQSITLAQTGLHGDALVDSIGKAIKLEEFVVTPGTDISASTLKRIVEACRLRLRTLKYVGELRRLTFGDDFRLQIPFLESFELRISCGRSWNMLHQDLATFSPLLKSLSLYEASSSPGPLLMPIDLRSCLNLTHLQLRLPITSQRDLQLPKSLRVLKLSTSHGLNLASDFFLQDGDPFEPNDLLMWDLPNLEEVHLNFPGLKFHRAGIQFNVEPTDKGKDLSTLRSFWIQNAIISGDEQDPFGLCGRLLGLQEVGITDCLSFKDDHVDILLLTGKHLEYMNLSGTSITGVALKSIVRAGHVKRLVINDCAKIGRDAVDWARKVGLQVDFRMTSLENGGKKVRY